MSSKIEWTEHTWNPISGCDKISAGCKNCYAEAMAQRLQRMGVAGYENGFKLTLQPQRLLQPLTRKTPTKYFVNSMSDLFHEDVPEPYIDRIFSVIEQCPQHIFQILTKRAKIMSQYFATHPVPDNAWIGVTVENRKQGIPRIDYLRTIDAPVRFLSIEPLLENLGEINLGGVHWVIVGGESGPNARPMKNDWVINIKKQCEEQGCLFFFKQWGGWGADGVRRSKKNNGRLLEGVEYNDMPEFIV
jgi:putative ABC transporter subunit